MSISFEMYFVELYTYVIKVSNNVQTQKNPQVYSR